MTKPTIREKKFAMKCPRCEVHTQSLYYEDYCSNCGYTLSPQTGEGEKELKKHMDIVAESRKLIKEGKIEPFPPLSEEMEWEIVDILRAVHVHGVDGDFDETDYPEHDPPSMSIQTAEKKILAFLHKHLSMQREKYELLALLSPQTDEEECQACKLKPFGTIAVDDVHNPHCIQCGRKIVSDSPVSEEMEWEKAFENQFVFSNGHLVTEKPVIVEKLKAFLRKQLDLQEKRFREIVGDDEQDEAYGDPQEPPIINPEAVTRNAFRAELRSKLSSKK